MDNNYSAEKNNAADPLRHICLCCGESYKGLGELFLYELEGFIKFPVCLVCRSNIWSGNLVLIAVYANSEVDRAQLARMLHNSFSAYEGSPS